MSSLEHEEFMRQLQENVSAMVGGKPVAVVGNEENGVYGILLSTVGHLPDGLIMITVVRMIVDQMGKDMAERFNEMQAQRIAGMPSPSKFSN